MASRRSSNLSMDTVGSTFDIVVPQPVTGRNEDPLSRVKEWSYKRRSDEKDWQEAAYSFAREIPEIGQAIEQTANTVKNCELVVLKQGDEDEGEVPVTDPDDPGFTALKALVSEMSDSYDEILYSMARGLQIAGECYLVGTDIDGNGNEAKGLFYEVYSIVEMNPKGKHWEIMGEDGQKPLPDDAVVDRLYRPDAEYRFRASSPMRRVLSLCGQLLLLEQNVKAIAESRLSAQVWYMPQDITLHTVDETQASATGPNPGMNPVVRKFLEHASAPLHDPDSAARLVPLVMTGPEDGKDRMGIIDVSRAPDAVQSVLREEVITRIARGLDIPIEVIFGLGTTNHWCVPVSNKAFTPNGWVDGRELKNGDLVLTLNPDTGKSEFQPVKDKYVAAVENEPMVRINFGGQSHDSLSTPNHRWFVQRGDKNLWTTSQELRKGDRIPTLAAHDGLPTVAKWNDDLVRLVAWHSADGTLTPGGNVKIGKSHKANPEKVAQIRDMLTRVFGPGSSSPMVPHSEFPAWREVVEDRGMTLFTLNKVASAPILGVVPGKDKVIPTSFVRELTLEQLSIFVEAWLDSDGESNTLVGQRVPERLDALELAAVLSGWGVRRSVRKTGGFGKKDQHFLRLKASKTAKVRRVGIESFTGEIWCPVTDNSTWLMQDNFGNACFTGNTSYGISAQFLGDHIEPLGNRIAAFLTRRYLRPMLMAGTDMEYEEAAKYRIIFDTAPVTSRVDDGPATRAAFDRGVASEERYRSSIGLTNADAPEIEEKILKDLRAVVMGAKATYGAFGLKWLYAAENGDISAMEALEGFNADWEENRSASAASPTGEEEIDPVEDPEEEEGGDEEDESEDGGTPEDQQDEPARPDSEEAAVLARIHGVADRDLRRAIERASSRAVAKAKAPRHSDILGRLNLSTNKLHQVSNLSDNDLRSLSLTRPGLVKDSFGDLEDDVKNWLFDFLDERGEDPVLAEGKATRIAVEFTEKLQDIAVAALSNPIKSHRKGFLIPSDLLDDIAEELQ